MTTIDLNARPLGVVTGGSSGIGLELARQLVEHDFDVVIAADEEAVQDAAESLRAHGTNVEAVEADLATAEGVKTLATRVTQMGRPVDALLLNAGVGVSGAFVETALEDHLR